MTKNLVIAALVGVIAVGGALVYAQSSRTADVEVRVWESTSDPERNYISARPEGGSWSTLGTIPLGQGDASAYETTPNGRFRYSDITLAVPLPDVQSTTLDTAALEFGDWELQTDGGGWRDWRARLSSHFATSWVGDCRRTSGSDNFPMYCDAIVQFDCGIPSGPGGSAFPNRADGGFFVSFTEDWEGDYFDIKDPSIEYSFDDRWISEESEWFHSPRLRFPFFNTPHWMASQFKQHDAFKAAVVGEMDVVVNGRMETSTVRYEAMFDVRGFENIVRLLPCFQ